MKKIVIVLVLLLALIIIGVFWWQNGNLPLDITNKNSQIFIVKNGEGVREIANRLKSQGIIRDPIVFFLLTRLQGLDKQIQAGDFRINASMTTQEVANALTHGTLDIWITIPEGQRAGEIADILKTSIPNYNETWRTTLDQNEGYLFPDTYLIPRDADIDLIISIFKKNFDGKYESIKNLKTTKLTDAETLIVASIIEREAIFDNDRPIVASVIMNRLGLNMALQMDPTVQYALGYQTDTKKWWKKELTFEDLKYNSPYNTYKFPGLPVGPISNPGLSALKAALNPTSSDYLYYYSDNKGHLHFAKTIQGHGENIKKYGSE